MAAGSLLERSRFSSHIDGEHIRVWSWASLMAAARIAFLLPTCPDGMVIFLLSPRDLSIKRTRSREGTLNHE